MLRICLSLLCLLRFSRRPSNPAKMMRDWPLKSVTGFVSRFREYLKSHLIKSKRLPAKQSIRVIIHFMFDNIFFPQTLLSMNWCLFSYKSYGWKSLFLDSFCQTCFINVIMDTLWSIH